MYPGVILRSGQGYVGILHVEDLFEIITTD